MKLNSYDLATLIDSLEGHPEPGFTYYDLTAKYDVTVNVISPGNLLPEHTHDQDVINLVLDGELRVSAPAGSHTYGRGEWFLVPAAQPHAVEALTQVVLLELWQKN